MNRHTSLELSKKLAEGGCNLKSNIWWCIEPKGFKNRSWYLGSTNDNKYPAYDILNDICVKYAKEFFGECYSFCNVCKTKTDVTCTDCNIVCTNCMKRECKKHDECLEDFFHIKDVGRVGLSQDIRYNAGHREAGKRILDLLQQNKTQEAEDYIWKHTIFNKSKK